jgi:hypothetical protein
MVFSSPAVAYGTVFIGSYDGKMYALDQDTGALKWSFNAGEAIVSSPTVVDEKVFFCTIGTTSVPSRKVYCLSQSSGAQVWMVKVGTGGLVQNFGSPAVDGGKVFLYGGDGLLYWLGENDGHYIWSAGTGNVAGAPAVVNGRVFAAGDNWLVKAFDENTGTLVWSYYEGKPMEGNTVYGGRVFTSTSEAVLALYESSGSFSWRHTLSGGFTPRSSPAGAYSEVFVLAADATRERVYALSQSLGSENWHRDLGTYSGSTPFFGHSSPAVADDKVFVGSWDHKVYALDESDGSILWSYSTGDFVVSSFAVSDGAVFIGSWDKKVYAFKDAPPSQVSVTVDPNGGRIYVDNNPITVSTPYSWVVGSSHTLDPDSDYSPTDGKKLVFTQWTDGSTADPRSIVVPSGGGTYKAQWRTQYRLIINVSPSGGGTTNPATNMYWYDSGQSVRVYETPNPGYSFDHWDLDGGNVGSDTSYLVSINIHHRLTAFFSSLPSSGYTYVTIRNLDDDVHSGKIYIDGSEWGSLNNIPHFATYSTPDIEVTGNTNHEVKIEWIDLDEESGGIIPVHSKSLPGYVESGKRVEFAFELDPIFKVAQILNIPGFPLPDLWEELGFTTKIVYADFYKITSDGHFEIYYDPSSPYTSQSYLDYVDQAALIGWERLVPYLGPPNDPDGDGRIEILITNLNYLAEGSYKGMLGYCWKPPHDPNGLGMIYIDDNIHMWMSDWNFIKATVCHEFTHMIQYGYNSKEPWVLEGMAQFGADYALDISGLLQHYVDRFEADPDVSLEDDWYRAAYAFFEFLAEKFGQSIIRTVLKTVDYEGRVAVEKATGKSFSELFDEFAVRNYVNEYSGTSDGGTTFEGTDIYAKPFETHYLPRPPAYLHGTGSFEGKTYTTDYISFTNLQDPIVEIKFYGDLGRAFEVKVILVVGDFSSYEVRNMPLANNQGSLLIEDAPRYSQFALVVIRLRDDYPDATYQWDAIPQAAASLVFKAHSPVNTLVTAPNGLRVGYDPVSGIINEIPGAEYSGPGSDPQEIAIPNPVIGVYQIDAFGIGTGTFTITMQSIDRHGSTIDTKVWTSTAKPGERYTQEMRLEPAGLITVSVTTYVVHLESKEDNSTSSNIGTMNLEGLSYSLPGDTSKSSGTYSISYNPASDYSFVRWETSGGISVASSYSRATTASVSNSGTLRAIYKKVTIIGKRQLTTHSSDQDLPSLIVVDTGMFQGYFLAYQSWETGDAYNGDIFVEKYDNNWNLLKRVQATNLPSYQDSPSLALVFDGYNYYLKLAYVSDETGNYDIFVQAFDINLNFVAKKQVTTSAYLQDFPSIIFDGSQSIYIAYQSWETEGVHPGDIFIAKFNLNLEPLGRVQVTSEPDYQDCPSLLYNPETGIIYVAYVSNETGNLDIFMKQYDSNLNYLGRKFQLTTHYTTQFRPSLAPVYASTYPRIRGFQLAYYSWETGASNYRDIFVEDFDLDCNRMRKTQITNDQFFSAMPSIVPSLVALGSSWCPGYVTYVSDETGNWDIWLQQLVGNQPPVASFRCNNGYGYLNHSVVFIGKSTCFNASESHDPDGSIVSYTWDFGDGNTTTISSPIVNHNYTKTGTYTVTLNVTDNQGSWNIVTVNVQVILLGDLNGDGKVNIIDIAIVAKAFGKKHGDPDWNPSADLNNDKVINIVDIAIVAREFGSEIITD